MFAEYLTQKEMKIMIEMKDGKEYFLSVAPHEIYLMDSIHDTTYAERRHLKSILKFKCAWKINPLKTHLSKDKDKWGWDGLGTKDIKSFYQVSLNGSVFTKTLIDMDKPEIDIDLTKPIEVDSKVFDDLIESTHPDSCDYSGDIIQRLKYRDIATLTNRFKEFFFESLYSGGSCYIRWEYRVSMLDSPIMMQLALMPNQKNITIVRQKQ